MQSYLFKSPWWLRAIYPNLTWKIPAMDKVVYLTFDDGPTPDITPWVINQLAQYKAMATFFLIGKNVAEHPEIYRQLKEEGHSIGNHTYNHFNGWRYNTKDYLENVGACQDLISTKLFRPPYGRITKKQARTLEKDYNIIMWDIITGDFDKNLDGEKCYQNVIRNVSPGSIIVFHDSVKAWPRLQEALPKTLQYLKEKGFRMEAL